MVEPNEVFEFIGFMTSMFAGLAAVSGVIYIIIRINDALREVREMHTMVTQVHSWALDGEDDE